MFELQSLLAMVWLTLIAALPIAFLIASILRWKAPTWVKPVTVAACFLICLPALLFLTGLRFTEPSATVACIAVAYWAYCFLVAVCVRRRLTLLRALLAVVLFIPVLASFAVGVAGMPLAAMFLADFTARPVSIQQMGDGLICKLIPWGNLGVSGYSTALFQTSLVPFFERKVAEIEITEQRGASEPASCTDVQRKYSSR